METPALPAAQRRVSVLAVGFGTAVAMWAVGYVGRHPFVVLPSPLLLVLMLLCLGAGGVAIGRYARLGWRHGAAAGAVCGLLNLLVLGSFLSGDDPNRLVPSALAWLPGSILLAAGLVAGGAVVGARWSTSEPPYDEWLAVFVRVSIVAALLLLGVGGLVTSAGAGLAVVDWPNSYGYNMFLYPFSRMTGGIYYEHAHRLFGALVGVTTFVLALLLQLRDSRSWVRRTGWAAVALVIVQGLMGGLRVTGGFTLSTSIEDMRPSLALAMTHGVLGQVFLAVLVVLGVVTSAAWRNAPSPLPRSAAGSDRTLGIALVGAVLIQLVLGAAQRHLSQFLLVHIVFGVSIVAPLAIHVGFRSWLNTKWRPLRRFGLAVLVGIAVQLLLGIIAYTIIGLAEGGQVSTGVEIVVATIHQWFGALLLAFAVGTLALNLRRFDGAA